MMNSRLDAQLIERALVLLDAVLVADQSPPTSLVICGGASLVLSRLHSRTTRDVDILALYDSDNAQLLSPAPLPGYLVQAARVVAHEMDLTPDWLNNEPSSGHGGLFQLGLPEGMSGRLTERRIGDRLTIYLISRLDQIHLKLYASIDQPGSYHTVDLQVLQPTSDELGMALRWATTHDVSPAFLEVALNFLREMGHGDVASRL